MLGDRVLERVTAGKHHGIGKMPALPWFYIGAGASKRRAGDEEEDAKGSHTIIVEVPALAFREQRRDLCREDGFVLRAKAIVNLADNAFAIDQE